MPITPKKKKELLEYYDEQVASGSNRYVADTSTKFNVSKGSVRNYVKQRDKAPQEDVKEGKKEDTTDTYTEIAAERKLDEQTNGEKESKIKNPRAIKIKDFLKEKFPKIADEILEANELWALEQTFKELEIGVPAKDIEALKKGYSLKEVLGDKRKPLTIDDEIKRVQKEQELKEVKINNIWTGDQLEQTQNTFDTKTNIPQTNENYRIFDKETMASLKVLLELQAIFPALTSQQQTYFKKKFMIEKGLSIFPLLERILYSNIEMHQEPQLYDEEIHSWWKSIPIDERIGILNKLNGQTI